MTIGTANPWDDAQERAAHLLITPTALFELDLRDARSVVSYMRPMRVKSGTVFIREGEVVHTDYMLLVLEGETTVEYELVGLKESMVMSVMGEGSLIGEMGIIDGKARSATCTATTDLLVAVMSREALSRLIEESPAVGAKLVLAISKCLSDRLRETNRKLRTFARVSRALQEELGASIAADRAASARQIET